MNVLLTCAGRRVDLVELFKRAGGGDCRVVACDRNPSAPALRAADVGRVVPVVDDPAYVSQLMDVCAEEQVDLLVSLNDFEIALLAPHREQFLGVGTFLLMPSSATVEMCLDKLACQVMVREAGLDAPATFGSLDEAMIALDQGLLAFPLVVKSRRGTSSLLIEFVEDEAELRMVWDLGQTRIRRAIERSARPGIAGYHLSSASSDHIGGYLIIQEQVVGVEYGIDVLNDLDGRHVSTLVRRKLALRGSEADRVMTVDHPGLMALGARLGLHLRHPGNLNVDVIENEHGLFVVDVNPRMGHELPLHAAGRSRCPVCPRRLGVRTSARPVVAAMPAGRDDRSHRSIRGGDVRDRMD